ncbi:hypothetical protein [Selenomonas artemidis]|uniref:Uncharacterized protein n=1 Tax=Selenomonas artemidis F0399 TaxID=749551 RepID=E7N322_9FIRM|nr:hypothetical protein [Selenomonas artemidis]EFW29583.1 hypothetical protein HMPREF9555_01394 [Selenomonas artemidis F0399]
MDPKAKAKRVGAAFIVLFIVAGLVLMYTGSDAVVLATRQKEGILTAEQVKMSFDSVSGRLVREAVREGDEVRAPRRSSRRKISRSSSAAQRIRAIRSPSPCRPSSRRAEARQIWGTTLRRSKHSATCSSCRKRNSMLRAIVSCCVRPRMARC